MEQDIENLPYFNYFKNFDYEEYYSYLPMDELKNKPRKVVAMPVVPKALPVEPVSPRIELVYCPYIPTMHYPDGTLGPGYWVDEIQPLLHIDDFNQFYNECSEFFVDVEGRFRIYPLKYIRWLNGMVED